MKTLSLTLLCSCFQPSMSALTFCLQEVPHIPSLDTSLLCPSQWQEKQHHPRLPTVSKCQKWRSGDLHSQCQHSASQTVTSFQRKKRNNFNSGNQTPQDQPFWIFKLKCQICFCLLSVYTAVIISAKYPVSFVVDFLRNSMIEYDVPFPLRQLLLNFNASWFSCHLCREQYFP